MICVCMCVCIYLISCTGKGVVFHTDCNSCHYISLNVVYVLFKIKDHFH